MTRRRVVVATRSPHKLAELRALLDLPEVELVSLDELGVLDEVDETGDTFEENARLKALAYAELTDLPTLADDSGLEVDALGGGPGVRTRRYAGEHATDADNNAKLLDALSGLAPEGRGAQYVCVLALAEPGEGRVALMARGTCRGRIAPSARGSNGFGYDPIFEPQQEPPGGRTLGEWSAAEKGAISHRGRAAREMSRLIRARGV